MRRRLLLAPAVAVAATLLLAGCSSTASDATSELRAAVFTIAEQAADGEIAAALASLAELEADVQTAAADGRLTAERAADVQQSIDLVRADLSPTAPVITELPPADPTSEPVESDDTVTEDDSDDVAPPAQETPVEDTPVEETPVVETPVDQTPPADDTGDSEDDSDDSSEESNNGPGNGNGNGNGKDKDKEKKG